MSRVRLRFWARVAFLFLLRSGRSTAALSLMVVSAVSMLIYLSALSVGVNDAMMRNTVGLFSGQISGHDLAASVAPEDLEVKGVSGVLRRVYLPGVLSNDYLGQPLVICGIDADRETAMTALQKKIVEGRYPQAGRSEVMLSKPLAEALRVHIGESLRFTPGARDGSLQLMICGIYQTGIDALDRGLAFCPLELLPAKASAWSAAVFLENGVEPDGVMKIYQQRWAGTYQFESWADRMPDLRQLIDLENISMAIVIILVFSVVSIGIACSFVIFIIRNMREYGIMKAMGVMTWEMSLLLLIKVALMNAVACGVGLVLGSLAVEVTAAWGGIDISAFTSHNQYFSVSGIIFPRLTGFSLLAPPVTSFIFSLLAAAWPAALLARKKTADIMRMV